MATKKRKNPQDTTFRNINALKKRVKELEKSARRAQMAIPILAGCIRLLAAGITVPKSARDRLSRYI